MYFGKSVFGKGIYGEEAAADTAQAAAGQEGISHKEDSSASQTGEEKEAVASFCLTP